MPVTVARHKMICAPAFQVEREAAFGDLAAVEFVAFLQFVEKRSEFALRHEFDEEFEEAFFIGRGDDRVGALDALFAVRIDAERGVLACFERERAAGIDFYQPQIFGQLFALENVSGVVLVGREEPSAISSRLNLRGCTAAFWVGVRRNESERLVAQKWLR